MEEITRENICYKFSLNDEEHTLSTSNAIHNKDVPSFLYKLKETDKEAFHLWNTLDWEHVDPLDIRYYIALDGAIQERNNFSQSFMGFFHFGCGLNCLLADALYYNVFFNIKAPKYGVHEGVENFVNIKNSNDFANVYLSNKNYNYAPSSIRELEGKSKNGVELNYIDYYNAFGIYIVNNPKIHLYSLTNMLKQMYETIKKSKHHIAFNSGFCFVDYYKTHLERIKYTINYYSRSVGVKIADIKLYCLSFDIYMEDKLYKYISWINFIKTIYPNFNINITMFNSFYEDRYYDVWEDDEIIEKILINERKVTSYKISVNTTAKEIFDYIADNFFSKTIEVDKTLYPQSPRGMIKYKPKEIIKMTSDFYQKKYESSETIRYFFPPSGLFFNFNVYSNVKLVDEEFYIVAKGEKQYNNEGELTNEYGLFDQEILERIKTDAFPWLQQFCDFTTNYTFDYCNKIKLKKPLYGKLRAFGVVSFECSGHSQSIEKRHIELPLEASADGLEYEIDFYKIPEVSQFFYNNYKIKKDIPTLLKENKIIDKNWSFYYRENPSTGGESLDKLIISKAALESWNYDAFAPLISRVSVSSRLQVNVSVDYIYVDYTDGPHPFEFV